VKSIQERFRDAAETAMPPSRLSADQVYTTAWRRRRRRAATWTAAGLVVALVVTVVGIGVLRSAGHNQVAEDPTTTEEDPPPWLRNGAVVTAVATDADHLYAVMSVCRSGETCSYRLVGSDDAGNTWSVRQENFGDGVNRDVTAPAAGVLYQTQSRDNPGYVDTDPDSPKMLLQRKISTDGGRKWTDVREATAPVDAVPAGGWIECKQVKDESCASFIAYDPANARSAPLKAKPGFQVIRIVPSGAGFWAIGYDKERSRTVLASSPDRGRTWTTSNHDEDVHAPVTVDGITGYDIVSDTYPVKPTGPKPTTSPSESKKRVYRTADGGRTWQRVDPGKTLPDGALAIAQSYVARDGTHVVLMSTDTYARRNAAPFERYTSRDGQTYRPGGVTGLGAKLSRDSITENLILTSVAGIYLAHDDEVVYRSTDGLTWTRHPVNPPR
jgi:hypothetical protein